ncbi:hypothetical protein JOD47_001430 [Arthrobacter tumbae]|nr:hypothetical protein [Arthrobacter tumbae]
MNGTGSLAVSGSPFLNMASGNLGTLDFEGYFEGGAGS